MTQRMQAWSRRAKNQYFESRKQQRRKIAGQQIAKLLDFALEQAKKNYQLAERQAAIAWKISTRFNMRLGERRLLFCHYCKAFIVPPQFARYRLSKKNGKALNITCLKCGMTYHKILGSSPTENKKKA